MVQHKYGVTQKMHEQDLNNNKQFHSSDGLINKNHKENVQRKPVFYSETDLRKAKVSGQDAKIISLMMERYSVS